MVPDRDVSDMGPITLYNPEIACTASRATPHSDFGSYL